MSAAAQLTDAATSCEIVRELATTLLPGISIILGLTADGWRFLSWSPKETTGATLPNPARHATMRCFASADAALIYFRDLCQQLRR